MKFVCEKCTTKYSIADQKVEGRVLKVRCKTCGHIIVVRGSKDQFAQAVGVEAQPAKSQASDGLAAALGNAMSVPASNRSPSQITQKGGGGLNGPGNLGNNVKPLFGHAHAEKNTSHRASSNNVAELAGTGALDEEWYLAVDEQQFGPMSFDEMCSRVKRGEARSANGEDAYVWRDGFEDWIEISKLPELRPYVPPKPPVKMKSGLATMDSIARSSGPGPFPPAGQSQGSAAPPAPPPYIPASIPAPPSGAYPALAPQAREPITGSHAQVAVPMAPTAPAFQAALDPLPRAYADGSLPATGLPLAPAAPLKLKYRMLFAAGVLFAAIAAVAGVLLVLVELKVIGKKDDAVKTPTPPEIAKSSTDDEAATPRIKFQSTGNDPESSAEHQVPSEQGGRRGANKKRETSSKTPPQPKQAAAAVNDGLTAEQRRLRDLYGSGGSETVPSAGGPKAGSTRGPSRQLSERDVLTVQRNNQAGIKLCWDRALKRDNSLSEMRAEVEVDIGESGIVKKVRVSAGNNTDLTGCLEKIIRRWVFPPSGEQTIAFPLIFRGS